MARPPRWKRRKLETSDNLSAIERGHDVPQAKHELVTDGLWRVSLEDLEGDLKLSQRLQDERAFVESSLSDSVICKRCAATLKSFADVCTAGLSDPCPGYLAIEKAKTDFAASRVNV